MIGHRGAPRRSARCFTRRIEQVKSLDPWRKSYNDQHVPNVEDNVNDSILEVLRHRLTRVSTAPSLSGLARGGSSQYVARDAPLPMDRIGDQLQAARTPDEHLVGGEAHGTENPGRHRGTVGGRAAWQTSMGALAAARGGRPGCEVGRARGRSWQPS